jgi:REP element-mobilizing transposase RayT
MPNHTHFLIRPYPEWPLSSIIKDLKGFTARQVNMLLSRNGPFWHPDYFDRFMRDQGHRLRTIRYIEQNPVKAGLCSKPEDWRFGSAYKSMR